MNIKSKVATALATGAVFLTMAGPSFAATNSISGTGAFSLNAIAKSVSKLAIFGQNNTSVFSNSIGSSANSGYNSSSFNVGGVGSVSSGPALNNTTVSNLAGSNTMTVTGCGCPVGSDASISNTGAFSINSISDTNTSTTTASQNNTAVITNNVSSNANSGNNSSSFNVGGTGGVSSSSATNNTTVTNVANENSMTVTP